MAIVRYLVNDVDASVRFYVDQLGFTLQRYFAPVIAILSKGELKLWLAGPMSSAAKAMPDGRTPEPGGWNRFVIEVEDLEGTVARMRSQGVYFRNEILSGPGGSQILCEDPSGNVIELFKPTEMRFGL